jgi:hypothetical protein
MNLADFEERKYDDSPESLITPNDTATEDYWGEVP